jgi:drug/metabolite transporter (DMT)-like permease
MVNFKAWAFLIGANLFWAGNIIFGKLIVGVLPSEWTVFLRVVVGLILLIPIAQFIEKPSWGQIWRNNWVLIILLLLYPLCSTPISRMLHCSSHLRRTALYLLPLRLA